MKINKIFIFLFFLAQTAFLKDTKTPKAISSNCTNQYDKLKTKLVELKVPEGKKNQILFVLKMAKKETKELQVCSGVPKEAIIQSLADKYNRLVTFPCGSVLTEFAIFLEGISQKRPQGNQIFGMVGSVINQIYSVKFKC